jgi:hypothetical protein
MMHRSKSKQPTLAPFSLTTNAEGERFSMAVISFDVSKQRRCSGKSLVIII